MCGGERDGWQEVPQRGPHRPVQPAPPTARRPSLLASGVDVAGD
jgi:hypothetical protein